MNNIGISNFQNKREDFQKHPKYQARSKSGWMYHTHITPIGEILSYNPLNDAFNKFLNDLKIDEKKIKKELEIQIPYRLIIKTDGAYDNIDASGKFKKSKFLNNRKFKQNLIDYYNPMGIFVKGPDIKEFKDTQYWIIELSPIFENQEQEQEQEYEEY